MELRLRKFKLYVQTLFNADFHSDWWVELRLFLQVEHDELFLFGDLGVLSINSDINEVSHSDHYTIVSLKLLLTPIELERVSRIVSQ